MTDKEIHDAIQIGYTALQNEFGQAFRQLIENPMRELIELRKEEYGYCVADSGNVRQQMLLRHCLGLSEVRNGMDRAVVSPAHLAAVKEIGLKHGIRFQIKRNPLEF